MQEQIRAFVEQLFYGVPGTAQAQIEKENIISAATQKYESLRAQGTDEQTAYNLAISSIGDISALLNRLSRENQTDSSAQAKYYAEPDTQSQSERRRSALLLTIAVMLYILCVIPPIITENVVGICLMFVIVAIATGLIVYRASVRSPRKADAAYQQDTQTDNATKSLVKAIDAVIGAVSLLIYFGISFSTGAWYITWIVFLISGAVQQIVRACFDLVRASREGK